MYPGFFKAGVTARVFILELGTLLVAILWETKSRQAWFLSNQRQVHRICRWYQFFLVVDIPLIFGSDTKIFSNLV